MDVLTGYTLYDLDEIGLLQFDVAGTYEVLFVEAEGGVRVFYRYHALVAEEYLPFFKVGRYFRQTEGQERRHRTA